MVEYSGYAYLVGANGAQTQVPVSQCGGSCAWEGVCLSTIEECFEKSKLWDGASYTGVTYKIGENGEYEMISVSECEFGCASAGMCADEATCNMGKMIGFICLGIFGCCFCTCLVVCLISFCKKTNELKQTRGDTFRRM